MKKQLEKDIQKSIIDYLRRRGIFFWKNNTAGIYKKSTGSYIPSQSVGAPDICVIHNGKFIGLEVKQPTGKQSPGQIEFERKILNAGGFYYVVTSINDVQNIGL